MIAEDSVTLLPLDFSPANPDIRAHRKRSVLGDRENMSMEVENTSIIWLYGPETGYFRFGGSSISDRRASEKTGLNVLLEGEASNGKHVIMVWLKR